MIGLVSATGMWMVRGACEAAGDALVASATALQRADTASQRLPWVLGRSQVVRHMDAQLLEAGQQARSALVILDGVSLEPGPGAESLDQIRAGVRTLIDQVDARQALSRPVERWRDRTLDRTLVNELRMRGEGLRAVGLDDTLAWTTKNPRGHTFYESHIAPTYFGVRREIVELDPEVAARVRPLLPQQLDHYQSYTTDALLLWAGEAGVAREDVARHSIWQLTKLAYRQHQSPMNPMIGASDLRRIVDEVAVHAPGPFPRPAWLDDAAADAYLEITPERATDLVLMDRATSREAMELHVAHALAYSHRTRFGGRLDEGVLMADAARRLPGGLGAGIPDGIEFDDAAALAWAREVRTASARELVASRTPDSALVHELLETTARVPSAKVLGNAIVARELLDALGGGSTARQQLVDVVKERLDDLIASSERGWHLEYASVGRAEAAASLLARVDAEASARSAATRAADSVTW